MDYAKTSLGTPFFLSPEICSGTKYNFKTDIWMIGCVLYELSSLKKPFEGENLHILIQNILNKDILPLPKHYSDNLKKIVNLLLKKDPDLRPTTEDILSMDFIIEKMKDLNINQESPHHFFNSNNSNHSESTSHNYSLSFQASPINENESHYLFDLGYGNLLKGINEVDEEYLATNNFLISNENNKQEKLVIKNNQNNQIYNNNNNQNSQFYNNNFTHKKYSPSYGINDMEQIMKNLNIQINDNEYLDYPFEKPSITKIQKENIKQNFPEKLSTEESKIFFIFRN